MKRFSRIFVPLVLLAAGLVVVGEAQEPERKPARVLDLLPMMLGTFDGSTPGNELHAIITALSSPSPSNVSNLSIRVTGKYLDAGVREQGVLRLESQGRSLVATSRRTCA